MFSDPQDVAARGVNASEVYPNSFFLPESGIQRGSTILAPGDAMSPGWPSLEGAYRLTEEEAKPTCPICSETFQIGQIKALELHVDSHLTSNLYCPVCNASFEVAKREDYQNHVQVCTQLISADDFKNIYFSIGTLCQRGLATY